MWLQIYLYLPLVVYFNPLMAAKCPTAPKSLQNVQICCPAPMPNWGVYNGECGSSGTQPSCRLACIFNATSALAANHNQLNLSQVRPMLERAFGMPLLIDAYVKNFGTCSNLVHSKYDQLTKLSHQNAACDRHALFYSLCAYSRLMVNCPTNLWQKANTKCQEARNYMRTCSWPALKMFIKST